MKYFWVAIFLALAMAAAIKPPSAFADGWAAGTKASNNGSIVNTRHNLSLSFLTPGFFTNTMNYYRNNYGEVCVYCHTPHGANRTIDAPLWNRTNRGNTYTLYNIPLQSGQSPTQPGANSLTCLSCHDGTTAVDSIINMPGSGKYSAVLETSHNEPFLDSWGVNDPVWQDHATLSTNTLSTPNMGNNNGCFTCHSAIVGMAPDPQSYLAFDAFLLGTDLTNDHPVGVQLPDTNIYDFNAPNGIDGSVRFYDTNSNGRADKNEVRFYNTGEGFEVECASCHDPHGVPHPGAGGWLVPTFLRRTNWGSQLCLTCHIK